MPAGFDIHRCCARSHANFQRFRDASPISSWMELGAVAGMDQLRADVEAVSGAADTAGKFLIPVARVGERQDGDEMEY